ncbi:MAG: metal ABC transporter substrate-binding protein [Pirellulaceae bacterium]|nr:metal ABC transporter substrate-binding protein [Pirellulaceae bacterium]
MERVGRRAERLGKRLVGAAFVVAAFVVAAVCGCGGDRGDRPAETPGAGKPTIISVNYPLHYFVERIGGANVAASFPVPADVDPAFWNPSDDTLEEIQQADLIVLNGADYARWRRTASLPELRCLDTSTAFADRLLDEPTHVAHRHGPGVHSHGGLAFTTWLDPELARLQAAAVHRGISRLRPDRAAELQAGFDALDRDLRQWDGKLRDVAARWADRPLLASHPVYQYLARRFDWDLVSLHWEPDQDPPPEQWADLELQLKNRPAKWMLWEDVPLEATRRRLDDLGIGVIVYRPCGNRPDADDWLVEMLANLDRLESAAANAAAAERE